MDIDPIENGPYAKSKDAYKDATSADVLRGNAGRDVHDQVRSRTSEERKADAERAAMDRSLARAASKADRDSRSAAATGAAAGAAVDALSGENGTVVNQPIIRGDSTGGGGDSELNARAVPLYVCVNGVATRLGFYVQ